MSFFKSEVAPKGLDFTNSTMIVASDKYMTILTVVGYPRYVGVGFLSNITNMPGVKIVIKHIPVPFSTLTKMLSKEVASMKISLSISILFFPMSAFCRLSRENSPGNAIPLSVSCSCVGRKR